MRRERNRAVKELKAPEVEKLQSDKVPGENIPFSLLTF